MDLAGLVSELEEEEDERVSLELFLILDLVGLGDELEEEDEERASRPDLFLLTVI